MKTLVSLIRSQNPKAKKNSISTRVALTFAALTTFLWLAAGTCAAQVATVLYSFNGTKGNTDIQNPYGPLIADKAGNFYGTALNGGTAIYYGGVFELSPPATKGGKWTETVLYNFPGGADGQASYAALAMDANGNLYGTTAAGGAAGYGTVFELSPPEVQGDPWTETVLYSFLNDTDGNGPIGGLIFDKNGNLYGTADGGGIGGGGVIFELSPPAISGGTWAFTTLASFDTGKKSLTGCEPESGLVLSPSGALYGTATSCGANGGGVAYQLSPPAVSGDAWTYTVIHVFGFKNGTGDGNFPQSSLILGKAGVLFGTTLMGGTSGDGTVYSLTPPATKSGTWKESVLHSFTGADGINPIGAVTLAANGTLYGTTADGGATFNGTIFKLVPPAVPGGTWTETTLFTCTNTSPSFPEAALSLINGSLYSTSVLGGTYEQGTVFKFVP